MEPTPHRSLLEGLYSPEQIAWMRLSGAERWRRMTQAMAEIPDESEDDEDPPTIRLHLDGTSHVTQPRERADVDGDGCANE